MTIFLNGVFDVLSPAHFNLLCHARFLSGARTNGNGVIVAIDSDRKARRDKGQWRPIFSEEERKNNLLSLYDSNNMNLIDAVYIFDTNEELYELIKKIKPSKVLKGADWKDNVIGSDLAEVEYYLRDERYSTTNIIERILEKYNCVLPKT